MKPTSKRCVYCHRWFPPDPRTRHQKTCKRKRCRLKRKQDARESWLARNPDCFEGRYPNTKRWLAEHPGYLKKYRAAHPKYVAADNRARGERKKRQRRRADIQDALPRREIARLRDLEGADIQDTIRRRLDGLLTVLSGPLQADIQVAIGSPTAASLPWPP